MRRSACPCLAVVALLAACGDSSTEPADDGGASDGFDTTGDVATIDDTDHRDTSDAARDTVDIDLDASDLGDARDSGDSGGIDTGANPDSGDTADEGDVATDADLGAVDADTGPPPTVFTFVPDEGPTLVDPELVTVDGLILNRLDVTLSIDATAEQLDAALDAVDGSIAASRPGMAWLTVTIPPVADLAAAQALAETLAEQDGILLATPSWMTVVHDRGLLAVSTPGTAANRRLGQMGYFPAWNAQSLAIHPVPVYVVDGFTRNETVPQLAHMRFVGPPAPRIQLPDEAGNFDGNHGFWVASILGALADDVPPVGTHPDPETSMDLVAVQTQSAGSVTDSLLIMDRELPRDAFFVANASFGVSENVERVKVLDMSLQWRAMVLRRSPSFVLVASTGNEGYIFDAARFLSPFVLQATTDDPRVFIEGTLDSLLATRLWDNAIGAYGDRMAGRQGSTLTVGWADTDGGEADDSNRGGMITMIATDVSGVCERIGGRCGADRIMTASGTSAAAPLAAGLVAWLASIDPSMTADELIAHVRRFYDDEDGYVNAYRATLALQERGVPVGRAIADVVTDGNIDETDISVVFEAIAASMAAASDYLLVDRTWDRTDLNGDGYTRSDVYSSFDLDGDGTTTFVEVETPDGDGGFDVKRIDEGSVSDLEFLCWMGYGPWFGGSTLARDDLLLDYCGVRPEPLAILDGREIGIRADGFTQERTVALGELASAVLYSAEDSDRYSSDVFVPEAFVGFTATVADSGGYTITGDHGSMSSSASTNVDGFTFDGDGNLTGGRFAADANCITSYFNEAARTCNFEPTAECSDAISSGNVSYRAFFRLFVPHRIRLSGSLVTEGVGDFFSTSQSMGHVYLSVNDERTLWEQYGGDGDLAPLELPVALDVELPAGNHYLDVYLRSVCGTSQELSPNPAAWEGSTSVSFTLTPVPTP